MDFESRIRVGMNASTLGEGDISARKRDIRRLADASAPERRKWLARAAFFHQEDLRYLKFLIPPRSNRRSASGWTSAPA